MTVNEAAQFAHVTPQMIRKWISDQRLKATRHGRDWWITEHSLQSFLELPRKNGRPRKN